MKSRALVFLLLGGLLACPASALAADTKPPKIVHTAITEAPAGKALAVAATITDESEIFEPTLYYRPAGTKRFLSASLTKGGGAVFTATIPDVAMTGVVEYFIEAYDANGNGPARFASDLKPQKIKTIKGAEPAKIVEPTPPPPVDKPVDKPAEKPVDVKVADAKPAGGLAPSGQVQKQDEGGGTGKILAIAGYSAIGVGVVGIGLGAYFGVTSKSQRDDAAKDPVASSAKTKLDSAQGSATAANVCYVAGGIVAAAGAALAVIPLFTGSSTSASSGTPASEKDRTFESHLSVGPSSVAWSMTF